LKQRRTASSLKESIRGNYSYLPPPLLSAAANARIASLLSLLYSTQEFLNLAADNPTCRKHKSSKHAHEKENQAVFSGLFTVRRRKSISFFNCNEPESLISTVCY
jgi:hypothetical protein